MLEVIRMMNEKDDPSREFKDNLLGRIACLEEKVQMLEKENRDMREELFSKRRELDRVKTIFTTQCRERDCPHLKIYEENTENAES